MEYRTEEKIEKIKQWHRNWKWYVWQEANMRCQRCNMLLSKINQSVVHHKTYKHEGSIYDAAPYEIWDKIELLCHDCHRFIHENESIDGVTKILKKETKFKLTEYDLFDQCDFCIECGNIQYRLNDGDLCENCYHEKRVFEKELEEFYWHN